MKILYYQQINLFLIVFLRNCKILGIITGKVEQSPLEYLGTNPDASKVLKASTDVIIHLSLNEQRIILLDI